MDMQLKLGSAVIVLAMMTLIIVVIRLADIKYGKKKQSYSYNDFTFKPFYLMIVNCIGIVLTVIVMLALSNNYYIYIVISQIQVLSGSWAIAV